MSASGTEMRNSGARLPVLRSSLQALRLPLRWLARQEAVVLLTAFAVVLTLFVFVKTADEMLEGDLGDFDTWLLRLLRREDNPEVPIGPPWLLQAATDVTALGGTGVLVVVLLAAIGYLALERRYGAVALVVIASSGGGLLSNVLKKFFARGRPDVVPHLISVGSPSFPSGHALLAAVIYLTLGALLARFAIRRRARAYFIGVSLLLTFLVGATRIYLGVHHPSDVLAGWSAGLAWALLCWLVARYLQYRGRVE